MSRIAKFIFAGTMNRIATVFFVGIAGLLVISALRAGFTWQEQRHPPMHPQATKLGELIIPSNPVTGITGLRQTTYRVPLTVEEVRRFYQQELPRTGWHYCGTQATPECTTKRQVSEEAPQIDVYQRMGTRGEISVTVEIKATWNAEQRQTIMTVVEAVPE